MARTDNSKMSFKVYFDDKSSLDMLTDEQAGKLIKKLISLKPNTENNIEPFNPKEFGDDVALNIVYSQLYNKVIRDTESWVRRKEANIKNGSKGGSPRAGETAEEAYERRNNSISPNYEF